MQVGASRARCAVVDGHEAMRAGVIRVLEREPDMEVVGQAGEGLAALALVERRRPDVAIVDVQPASSTGMELCQRLCSRDDVRVVIFTACHDARLLESALDAGVSGYVLKSSPAADLVRAVRSARERELFLDPRLAGTLIRGRGVRAVLSPREREVLQHLADGHTTEGVASRLYLSPATVRSYAESAMTKLESRNRTQAVARALRLELID